MQITDTAGSHQFPAMQRLSISKGENKNLKSHLIEYLNIYLYFILRSRVHYGVFNILASEFGGAEARAGADQRGEGESGGLARAAGGQQV